MIVYPNAKINIGLKVLDKREDGFHNIETLFFPVGKSDILEIVESPALKMVQSGIEIPGDMDPMENICVKAYNLIRRDYNIPPVELHLHKQIPVGAGLGGGSSDSVATLRALDSLFNLNIPFEKLLDYAASLGSDCPFFLYNRPMVGEGRGEILSPVDSPILDTLEDRYEIRLIHPPHFVSTAQAYGGIITREKRRALGMEEPADRNIPLKELLQMPVEEWREHIVNDFEETVFNKIPQLRQYKEQLYEDGAIYAAMSGSGSTMFGIFRK